MLMTINPLLTGELLWRLDSMGHSDRVIVVDGNFPAHRLGPPVIVAPGTDMVTMTSAILEVFPLDPVYPPILMDASPEPAPTVQAEITALTGAVGAREVHHLDRWAYYELAAQASVIVATGERRTWANVALAKGLCHVSPESGPADTIRTT